MRKEILPDPEILRITTEAILVPTIEAVANDAGREIDLAVFVFTDDKAALGLPHLRAGPVSTESIRGTLRLHFREAFAGRTLLYAEAIFDRNSTVLNCSGFSLKGDVKSKSAKRTAFTIRYSVWNWTGWS